jgi:hypothetical protein
MANWALVTLVVTDTTVITVRSFRAGEAVLSLPFTLLRIIRSLEARSRLGRLFWAQMSLRADSHDTIVRDAIVTSYTRFTPCDIRSSLYSIVISLRTSGRELGCLDAIMADSANLSGITSKLGSEITEVSSVTESLDKTSITELGVRAEEAFF